MARTKQTTSSSSGDRTSKSSALKLRTPSEINSAIDKENGVVVTPPSVIVVKKDAKGPSPPPELSQPTSEDMIKWMTEEKTEDERYWKILAEERRKALEEALTENEDLHQKLETVEEEMELLKAENEQLRQIVEQVMDQGLLNP